MSHAESQRHEAEGPRSVVATIDRKGWKHVRLGSFEQHRNNTCPRSLTTVVGGETHNIHYGDILVRFGEIVSLKQHQVDTLTEEGEAHSPKDYLQDGDIVIADTAEDETAGKVIEIQDVTDQKAVAGLHTIFLRPPTGLFVRGWLGYWMNSSAYHDQLLPYLTGIKVLSLSKSNLANTEVLYPSKDEQKRIVSVLSSIDTHIAALQSLIAKYEAIKKATVNLLLKPKKNWQRVKLGEAFTFGNGYTPSKVVKEYWENGTIPWFRMEDIRTNGHILREAIQHITPQAVKGTGLFPAGSFILSTTATLGEYALLIADSLANQQFTFLIENVNRANQIDTMWFLQYLAVIGEWCRKTANAGGLLAVNMTDLYNYEVPIPSLPEQKRIVAILDSIDDTISGLKSQLAKTKDIKQGMMAHFFG